MRSEIGKINLDTLFRERESLNINIVKAINQASDAWGIDCMRYEIRDIRMPERCVYDGTHNSLINSMKLSQGFLFAVLYEKA